MTNAAPPAAGKVHEYTTKSGPDTIEVGRKLVKILKPPQLLRCAANWEPAKPRW